MLSLVTVGLSAFAVSLARRLSWLRASRSPQAAPQWGLLERLRRVLRDGLLQSRVRNEPWVGLFHLGIFLGFLGLLPRTVVLFGRGFDPRFELLDGDGPLASLPLVVGSFPYLKDGCVLLVACCLVFFGYRRTVHRDTRLIHSPQGLGILILIFLVLSSDVLYDAALFALQQRLSSQGSTSAAATLASALNDSVNAASPFDVTAWSQAHGMLGPWLGALLRGHSPETLRWLAGVGLYGHALVILAFLNWLPYSKHLHILSAIPNLFVDGKALGNQLLPMAPTAEALLEKVDQATAEGQLDGAPVGIGRSDDLAWPVRLGLLTCTECGRCSMHCPALAAGKPLDPRGLTLTLRSHLLRGSGHGENSSGGELVPSVIDAQTVWACTTCAACEEQCPVGIRYVRPLVEMRRHLVLVRGEVPESLVRCFESLEHQGNPFHLPRMDRAQWAAALDVGILREVEPVDVLLWVGCSPSYDARMRRVLSDLVGVLRLAKVSFAILGDEENCTGEAARRAGNEYLFLQLAEKNIATLNRYRAQGRFRRIVTICPHCLNTIRSEYPALGGSYDVVPHTELLLELVEAGRIQLTAAAELDFVFHDPCTLVRYQDEAQAIRRLLDTLPDARRAEAEHFGRNTRCCGGGGARMWMSEGCGTRLNDLRLRELKATGASTVVTSCPFCLNMLSDAAAADPVERRVAVQDIVELVARYAQGPSDKGPNELSRR